MGIFTSKPAPGNNFEHFLKVTAKEWPTEKFLKEDPEENESGQTIIPYWSSLDSKVFWFFDTVEIKDFQGIPNKNFNFESRKDFNLLDLKKLTNEIVRVFGKDDNGEGKFTSNDARDVKEGFWSRYWMNDKNKHPIMLSFDNDDGLSFTIMYTGE